LALPVGYEIENFPLGAVRSPDCALLSDAAYALGHSPASLIVAVKRVVDQFKVISKV